MWEKKAEGKKYILQEDSYVKGPTVNATLRMKTVWSPLCERLFMKKKCGSKLFRNQLYPQWNIHSPSPAYLAHFTWIIDVQATLCLVELGKQGMYLSIWEDVFLYANIAHFHRRFRTSKFQGFLKLGDINSDGLLYIWTTTLRAVNFWLTYWYLYFPFKTSSL